jgi:hypothetical protein
MATTLELTPRIGWSGKSPLGTPPIVYVVQPPVGSDDLETATWKSPAVTSSKVANQRELSAS